MDFKYELGDRFACHATEYEIDEIQKEIGKPRYGFYRIKNVVIPQVGRWVDETELGRMLPLPSRALNMNPPLPRGEVDRLRLLELLRYAANLVEKIESVPEHFQEEIADLFYNYGNYASKQEKPKAFSQILPY